VGIVPGAREPSSLPERHDLVGVSRIEWADPERSHKRIIRAEAATDHKPFGPNREPAAG
jgi:hypothetical protein